MNQLLLIKLLVGSGVLVGGGATSAYFGTAETVEQYLNHDKKRHVTDQDFEGVVKPSQDESEPKSKEFKEGISKTNEKWNNLKDVCDFHLDSIYKRFWKEQKTISQELKDDLIKYCFAS